MVVLQGRVYRTPPCRPVSNQPVKREALNSTTGIGSYGSQRGIRQLRGTNLLTEQSGGAGAVTSVTVLGAGSQRVEG